MKRTTISWHKSYLWWRLLRINPNGGELVRKRKHGGMLMDPDLIWCKVAGIGKRYLSKLQSVFVQAAKCICPNWKREYGGGILMEPGLICGEASGRGPEWTHLSTPSILIPQKRWKSEIHLWSITVSDQCVFFYKQNTIWFNSLGEFPLSCAAFVCMGLSTSKIPLYL